MKPLLAVALLAAGLGSTVARCEARAPSAARLASLSTEELIGQFQRESEQTVGADTSVSMEGFIGTDAPLKFNGGLLGAALPKVSPTMRELVRRGLTALPALLDHLTDRRPTRLVIKKNAAIGSLQFFNEEYDPKDFAVKDLPAGVHRPGGEMNHDHWFDEYRIKVGDLCFVTLGQIVNRRLNAARYQPSGLFFVNSPLRTPALAAAARADWQGVTAAQFTAYLVRDLERYEDNWYNMSVLQRLIFYDHREGVAQAVRLLNRGVYDNKATEDFMAKVYAENDVENQKRLLDGYRSRYGENTFQVVRQHVAFMSEPLASEEAEALQEAINGGRSTPQETETLRRFMANKKRAVELKARHFPELKGSPNFAQLWLPCVQQVELVGTLDAYRDAEIDTAVRDLFNRALALHLEDVEEKLGQCQLQAECAKRFLPPRERQEITRAFNRLDRKNPRAMDAFLRKLAAEPALRSSAAKR